ncbi:hypothetical protein RQP46_007881 [Phenoliferia psychrophenolica]
MAPRAGGLLGALPAGLIPASITNTASGLLANVQAGVQPALPGVAFLENTAYGFTTDRSAGENFTIPLNSCGSNATRFGITRIGNSGNTPYFAPIASKYVYESGDFNQEQGLAGRCNHTAPGAQAIASSSDPNYPGLCESDVWHMDCNTSVLDALYTSSTYQLPITFFIQKYNPTIIQTYDTATFNLILSRGGFFGGSILLALNFVADPTA